MLSMLMWCPLQVETISIAGFHWPDDRMNSSSVGGLWIIGIFISDVG